MKGITILLRAGNKKKTCTRLVLYFWPSQEKHTQRQRHNKVCFTEAELLTAQVSVCSHYLSRHSPSHFQQQAKCLPLTDSALSIK